MIRPPGVFRRPQPVPMPLVSLFRQMYLRRLIVLLLALAVLITLAGGLSAGHWVFQRVLVSNALEANRVYAAKIAATVSLEVDTAHQLLAASATRLSRHWDENTWDEEAERLKTQSEIFNSVIVVRNDATLMANTPLRRNMLHRRMTTLGSVEALRLRKPLVSPPFHALFPVGHGGWLAAGPAYRPAPAPAGRHFLRIGRSRRPRAPPPDPGLV